MYTNGDGVCAFRLIDDVSYQERVDYAPAIDCESESETQQYILGWGSDRFCVGSRFESAEMSSGGIDVQRGRRTLELEAEQEGSDS